MPAHEMQSPFWEAFPDEANPNTRTLTMLYIDQLYPCLPISFSRLGLEFLVERTEWGGFGRPEETQHAWGQVGLFMVAQQHETVCLIIVITSQVQRKALLKRSMRETSLSFHGFYQTVGLFQVIFTELSFFSDCCLLPYCPRRVHSEVVNKRFITRFLK